MDGTMYTQNESCLPWRRKKTLLENKWATQCTRDFLGEETGRVVLWLNVLEAFLDLSGFRREDHEVLTNVNRLSMRMIGVGKAFSGNQCIAY